MAASKRVSPESQNNWELGGESNIVAETIPSPPKSGEQTLVRITHFNVYGPFDEVEFFVRVGDPDNPTEFGDLDSAPDWVRAELVEEIVWVDDVEMHRSEANEPFGREEEVPWCGTFDATLSISAGRNSIEIKVLAKSIIQSGVIPDWVVNVS